MSVTVQGLCGRLTVMKVAPGTKVRMEFELKVKDGDVIETSEKTGPIEFTVGSGRMLPGLEKRIEGLEIGGEKRGEIPPEEAFGTREMMPTKHIPRKEFPADAKLEVGQVFEAKGPTGQPVSFEIAKIEKEQVLVRFLHPLMGKHLSYRVKIIMIDDPQAKKRAVAIPPPPADALKLKDDEIKPE